MLPLLQKLFVGLAALGLLHTSLRAGSFPGAQEISKLDGSTLFGTVELSDDYTLRITSDSGIQNLPIAILSEKDFQKFSAGQDRSRDGRLWSERQKALEEEEKNNPGENPAIALQLSEIAPLAPLIAAYESSSLAKVPRAEPTPENTDPSPSSAGTSSTLHLFSGPGSLNVPTAPSTPAGPSLPVATSASEVILTPAAAAGEMLPATITPP